MSERVALTKASANKSKESAFSKPKRNFYESMDSPVEQVFHLQRTIGNQAVQGLIKSGAIQAKLKIGKPNDKYEQEADRVADKVMSMRTSELRESKAEGHSSLVQKKSTCPECPEKEQVQTKSIAHQITPLVQRQAEPEEEEEPVQAKPVPNQTPAVTSNIESGVNSLKGGGQPLSESTRSYFEPRFGADFSQIRIYNDSPAAETAKSINAKAFTKGNEGKRGQAKKGTLCILAASNLCVLCVLCGKKIKVIKWMKK